MTPEDFKAALQALGWKQADFCRRLDIDRHTPSRWMTGKAAFPRWVSEYLRAMLAIQRLHGEFVAAQANPVENPAPTHSAGDSA